MRVANRRRGLLAFAALLLIITASCDSGRPRYPRRSPGNVRPPGANPYQPPSSPTARDQGGRGATRPAEKESIRAARAKMDEATRLIRSEDYDRAERLALAARDTIEADASLVGSREADDLILELNKLIVLCRRSVEGSSGFHHTPNPVPYNSAPWGTWEIPPPGTPKSSAARPRAGGEKERGPAAPPPARSAPREIVRERWGLFVDALKSGGNGLGDLAPGIEEAVSSASGPAESLIRGAYGLARLVQMRVVQIASTESKVLQEYAGLFLSDPASVDDAAAFEFLAERLQKVRAEGGAGHAVRWMALVQFDRLVSAGREGRVRVDSGIAELLQVWPNQGAWYTTEQKYISGLKQGDGRVMDELLKSDRVELRAAAVLTLLRWMGEAPQEQQEEYKKRFLREAKAFPSDLGLVAAPIERAERAISKLKPCARCKGTHRLPMHNGEGNSTCNRCTAPFQLPPIERLLSVTPCGTCRQSGFLSRRIGTLCPDCWGLGTRYR